MNLYIDTCVLPRCQLETGRIYREKYGPGLGFELLPMFDIPDFEDNLRRNLDLFASGPLLFHEPVWGVEHTAPKGSDAYEESMHHIRLTRKYAEILHPEAMVIHLNNCPILPKERDAALRTALENLEELRDLFPGVRLLVENTGIKADDTVLLNQDEFTDICRSRDLSVLIDIGHANANGWDLPRLLQDLQGRISGFHLHNNDGTHDLHDRLRNGTLYYPSLIGEMNRLAPDAYRVIEYTRPSLHGDPLLEDIGYLQRLSAGSQPGAPESAGDTEQLHMDHLKYIFMNMDDAVCATRINGELLYANPAAEKLFGLADRQHIKLWQAIPLMEENDALIQLFIDGIMKKRKSIRSLADYVNSNGERFHLHVSLTCDDVENGMFLIVISDLTEMIRVHSAFVRYTSPEIANYVLTAPEGEKQGGDARDVTVLMSDLRGFTSLSTRLPSSALVTMLNHYFEVMSVVIYRRGGTIIEFLGDGIFVVFGAPKEMADHASAAVSCAVEMQNAMAEVNEWNRSKGWPELEMGIGIHTGRTVVGNIGSSRRMKYGCMGEPVNLAGRLEQFSTGSQILISAETASRIDAPLDIVATNDFMPKGARQKMEFCNITGIGDLRLLRSMPEPEEWILLPNNKELSFFILDGKNVEGTSFAGSLTRISRDEKYGMLASVSVLQPLQDLMIRLGEQDIYAKVLSRAGDEYLLRFSVKPDHLAALL